MFSQNSQSLRQTPNSSFYIRDILGADSGPNETPEKYPEYGPRGGQALVGYPPGPYTSHVMAHQSLVPSSRAYPLPFTGRGKYHYTFYLNVKMTIFWKAIFLKNKTGKIDKYVQKGKNKGKFWRCTRIGTHLILNNIYPTYSFLFYTYNL